MNKWEYRVERIERYRAENEEGSSLDEVLEKSGQEYWELVAATDRLLFFKRPYRAHPVKNTEGWSGPVKAK